MRRERIKNEKRKNSARINCTTINDNQQHNASHICLHRTALQHASPAQRRPAQATHPTAPTTQHAQSAAAVAAPAKTNAMAFF